MPDTANVLRDRIAFLVDALRKIDAVRADVKPGGTDEDAVAAYSEALSRAKLIARQALPITY